MKTLNQILKSVAKTIPARSTYAHALLNGDNNWAGSDLAAGARKWSSYRNTRSNVMSKLEFEGVQFIKAAHNEIFAVVPTCVDDYGNQVFKGRSKSFVQYTAKQTRMI